MEHKNQVFTFLMQVDRTSLNNRDLLTNYNSPKYSVWRREQWYQQG